MTGQGKPTDDKGANRNATGAGTWRRALSTEQIERLAQDVPPEQVLNREVGAGSRKNYLVKEYLWPELHAIFGVENVGRRTLDMTKVGEYAILMRDGSPGVASCWTCKCELTIRLPVEGGPDLLMVNEGTGTCTGTAKLGDTQGGATDAHEIAIKGAETDAFKRAVAPLGRRLGLDIEKQKGLPPVLTASQQRMKGVAGATTAIPTGKPATATGTAKAGTGPTTTPATSTPATSTTTGDDGAGVPEDLSATRSDDPWDSADPFGTAKPAVDYAKLDKLEWTAVFKRVAERCTASADALLEALDEAEAMRAAILARRTAMPNLTPWFGTIVERLDSNLHRIVDTAARGHAAARVAALQLDEPGAAAA